MPSDKCIKLINNIISYVTVIILIFFFFSFLFLWYKTILDQILKLILFAIFIKIRFGRTFPMKTKKKLYIASLLLSKKEEETAGIIVSKKTIPTLTFEMASKTVDLFEFFINKTLLISFFSRMG